MDEYHNILSEDFPSPVRENDPLPPTPPVNPTEEQNDETIHSTLEQIVEEHANGSPVQSTAEEVGVDAEHSVVISPLPQTDFTIPATLGETAQDPAESPTAPAVAQSDENGLVPGSATPDPSQHGVSQSAVDTTEEPVERLEIDDPTDRRKGGVKYQSLTDKEKKERQKLQNRRAAEKSRAKRRGQVSQLEIDVNTYTEENARLRARLAELQANQLPSMESDPAASSSKAPEVTNDQLGVDYSYLGKIQSELIIAKTKLYEREIDYLKLRGIELDPAHEASRQTVANHGTTVFGLQAEVTTLEGLLEGLEKEKVRIAKEVQDVGREVQRWRAAGELVAEREAVVEQGESMDVDGANGLEEAVEEVEERMEVDLPVNGELERTTGTSTPAASTPPIRTSGIGVGSGVPSSVVMSNSESIGASGADKSLLDISGWVDAAVRDWHEDLPVPREADIPMEHDRSLSHEHESITS